MDTLQYFSIFTTEKNRKGYRNHYQVVLRITTDLPELLPVGIDTLTQIHLYDPLFRLCHYRRVKAP